MRVGAGLARGAGSGVVEQEAQVYIKQPDCRDCIHYSVKAHKADPDGYVCGCNLRPFPAQCWDSHAREQPEPKRKKARGDEIYS